MAVLRDEERRERSPSRTGCGKRWPGFRGCRTKTGFRRSRRRRIKKRMLWCRQIDINRSSLEGRRAACNYAPRRQHTPDDAKCKDVVETLCGDINGQTRSRFQNQEPPCRICTRASAAFNSRTLENHYKSPVTRRREYCEPRRCSAKVGTDLRSELDSRFYNVDRVADKIRELRRNVQNFDDSKRDKRKIQQKNVLESVPDARIIDLKNIHDAVDNCLREMGKIKTFLENENSWWKLLKARSIDCCQQKLPHLHGVLDGSSVTLMLLEEGTDQLPRHFVTVRSQKRNDVTSCNFRTSSRELESEQHIDPWKEHTEEYLDSHTVPYYNLDIKSMMIEVASTDAQEPTQGYIKRVTSKQSIAASEFWIEAQEGRSDEKKIPDRSSRSKETRDKIQFQDKKRGTDRSNIVPPREIYGQNTQTMLEDKLKPRETFSSENTGSKKLPVTADFESNVDLNTKLSSRNMANHKSRTKAIIEKGINHIQKLPTKLSKAKSRD